jgi:hypothetical protein
LLKAYFDGSWNGKPPGITSVAGYVASLAEWERVETEWQRWLDEWSMDRFHLSGLRNIIGAGEEMAASCIQSFTRIIESSQLCAIGAALLDVDWEEDDWGHDPTVRLASKYEQCLDSALSNLGKHAKEHFPSQQVAVICCGDASERKIKRVFARRQKQYPQLDEVRVNKGERCRALEIADLGVGLLRQSWSKIASDETEELPWGAMPGGKGTRGRNSVWSLRQGAIIVRAVERTVRKRKAVG